MDGSLSLLPPEVTGYSGGSEYTCYLRTRVLGAEDSLVGIKLDAPTGFGSSLVVGDQCLVWDTYNRVFVYKLREGPFTEDIPHVVGVDGSRYWELLKYFISKDVKVEQYSISSIPLGSEYVLTHGTHNRVHSMAPVVQVSSGGLLKTGNLKMYVVSANQLKIVPVSFDLNDVKINLVIQL